MDEPPRDLTNANFPSAGVFAALAAIGSVPLVGREVERNLIAARLEAGRHPPGSVTVISGEAGVGKTRLAAAVAPGPGRTVVRLQCDEHLQDVPYAPFMDLAERLEGIPGLLSAPHPAADSSVARFRLFEEVYSLLPRSTEGSLCVFVVDQLEWIDAASLDLLRHLVWRAQRRGGAVLATLRAGASRVDSPLSHLLADWNRERVLLEVPLSPLPRAVSDELVTSLLGNADPALRAMVYDRTDGLPFFVEEFVRLLLTDGHAVFRDGSWSLPDLVSATSMSVSFGLAAAVLRRLSPLPEETQHALRAASVLGSGVHLRVLAAVIDRPESSLVEDLAPAVAMQLFQVGTYEIDDAPSLGRFTHALIRDALYSALSREERQAIHWRACEVLASMPAEGAYARTPNADAALLAYHAGRAGAWELAYKASLAAGDVASSVLADRDALAHFDRARTLARTGRVTPDAAEALTLDYRLVSTLKGVGHLEDSALAAQEMAQHARVADDQRAEAWALIQVAGAETFSGRFEAIAAGLDRGTAIAQGLKDDGLLATALTTRGVLLSAEGLLDQADHSFRLAVPLAERAGNPATVLKARTYVGLTAVWRGRFREAIERCEAAVTLAEASNDLPGLADARFSLALALGGCGRYEDAFDALHQLLDLARTSGEAFYAARVPNTIGWIYRELALVDQALPWDECASGEPDDHGGICHFKALANSLINLGMDYILLGRLDEADAALARADQAASQTDYLRWRAATRLSLTRGELSLARGDGPRALEYAAMALTQATSTHAVKHAHQAHDLAGRALGLAGRQRDAIERLEMAVSSAESIAYMAGHWRSLGHLGAALSRQGRVNEASERYAEAGRIVEEIAGSMRSNPLRADFLASPEVVDLLAQSGAAGDSRAVPLPMGLSERETDVLRLVAEGLTNAQIADRLYISPKTVSSHLVNIFGKIGVTSRASATRFALEHGLV